MAQMAEPGLSLGQVRPVDPYVYAVSAEGTRYLASDGSTGLGVTDEHPGAAGRMVIGHATTVRGKTSAGSGFAGHARRGRSAGSRILTPAARWGPASGKGGAAASCQDARPASAIRGQPPQPPRRMHHSRSCPSAGRFHARDLATGCEHEPSFYRAPPGRNKPDRVSRMPTVTCLVPPGPVSGSAYRDFPQAA
jgi:hypothetical protein